MRDRLRRLGPCVFLLGLAGASAGLSLWAAPAVGQPKQTPQPPAAADCVAVRGEASFASVGYDHLVHLTSTCRERMRCSVRTDVNPDAASVELAPNETKTVVTWRGSPAREFRPIVRCEPSSS